MLLHLFTGVRSVSLSNSTLVTSIIHPAAQTTRTLNNPPENIDNRIKSAFILDEDEVVGHLPKRAKELVSDRKPFNSSLKDVIGKLLILISWRGKENFTMALNHMTSGEFPPFLGNIVSHCNMKTHTAPLNKS